MVAPPGTPPERTAALRKALADMVDDPALRADAGKSGYQPGLISGDTMTERLAALLRTPQDIVKETERLAK